MSTFVPINPRPYGSDEAANAAYLAGREAGYTEAERPFPVSLNKERAERLLEQLAVEEEALFGARLDPYEQGFREARLEGLEDAAYAVLGIRVCRSGH